MKFAMYGSGAAGSVFASYLRKGGADIILIDRYEAHMKKVAEEGMHFTIHQEEDGGYKDYDYQLKGFRTYTTAADAAAAEGKVDVIIYMTKATQLEQAIQDSMPVVGDTTVAVSLINGLGNDDNLFKVFPKERCIIGSGVLGTALPEPAHCVSTPAGGVQMNFGGAVRSELTDAACAEMLKCYRAGGCDAYWRDGEPGTDNNIYKFIWKKVCVNATGFGGTQRLARLVGPGMAKQMIYTARNIKADEAYRIGLVNAVYPLSDLYAAAEKLAGQIAGNAPIAVRAAKKAINEGLDLPMDEAVVVEEKAFGSCFQSADQQEGMGAFLEKRKHEPFINK